MIIVLKRGATKADADLILGKIEAKGLKSLYLPGVERTVLGAIGAERVLAQLSFESHPMVESVEPVLAEYKLVSRELHPHDTVVAIGAASVGAERFLVVGGPCSVETREQTLASARAAKEAGAHALRGGAYKQRTSPYAFQGLGVEGLEILRDVGRELELPIVTEVVEVGDVDTVARYADALQIGARNMQNFPLLMASARTNKPILLKRGMAATIRDLLLAAEYIMDAGNDRIVLCERGIRTFETATRNTLDLSAVPYIKQKSHLPVVVDPSHGTGVRELVAPMARAAAACGADGILVEVHENPAEAWSDGAQSLYPEAFKELVRGLRPFVEAAGKTL